MNRSRGLLVCSVLAGALGIVLFDVGYSAGAVRIKDITNVEGVRLNKLTGMGLVTGLNGTGGRQSPVTREFALNMLQRSGIRAGPLLRNLVRNDAKQRTNNLSVVTVIADLPPFARVGGKLDVTVSTFDDATSLQGGVLILTPLFGIDNVIYATASGPLSIGGFSFSGQAASVQKNHPTTARIPGGAIVEEEAVCDLPCRESFRLLLSSPDFETARRISAEINRKYAQAAYTVDAGMVAIEIPSDRRIDLVDFIGEVGALRVQPDFQARVVINERTGTVVIGHKVQLSPVAITHANLSVITAETPEVSQPAPFGRGRTRTVPRTELDVTEEDAAISVFEESATVGDLARALNALGVTPRDLSSIFQLLKEVGALHAELQLK